MDELRMLFDYNRWANVRFLDALETLSPEELRRDLRSSFPSPLATALHTLGAEWVWLERWNGRSPSGFPDASRLDSIAAVRARWDEIWEEQRRFLDSVEDVDLSRPLAYKTFKGDPDARPLGDLMRHVVNHATYHRGQLATMLRQLGKSPPSTDYVRYLREMG